MLMSKSKSIAPARVTGFHECKMTSGEGYPGACHPEPAKRRGSAQRVMDHALIRRAINCVWVGSLRALCQPRDDDARGSMEKFNWSARAVPPIRCVSRHLKQRQPFSFISRGVIHASLALGA